MSKTAAPPEVTEGKKPTAKIKPSTTQPTTIRRIKGNEWWFEPTNDLKDQRRGFYTGILREAVFDPKATVMKDVFCGSDRVSEATVTGILEIPQSNEEPPMPTGVTRKCQIGYDKVRKVFHDYHRPDRVITAADVVVLHDDGTSTAGWIE